MTRKKLNFCLLACASLFFCSNDRAIAVSPQKVELEKYYYKHHFEVSDINEHLPHLRRLASECSSAVEIGIRSMVSTWGILLGLSESDSLECQYVGIDLDLPPWDKLQKARILAESMGVHFQFWKTNDMLIMIPKTDLLFIDSLHTYCHLTYELEHFAPMVNKYIAMHDTSAPWGYVDDDQYQGDYSEYDPKYNRIKRGLWPAVEDFLARHPEWSLYERHFNNHGFTVLKRVGELSE